MEDMNALLIVIGIPVAAVALSGLGLHYVRTPWLRRISTTAISVQIVLAGAAWALLAALPREINSSGGVGDTCPRLDGLQGGLVAAIAIASIGIAAVALASGFIVVRRRAGSAWRLLGGIGSEVLVVAIYVGILATALCGMN